MSYVNDLTKDLHNAYAEIARLQTEVAGWVEFVDATYQAAGWAKGKPLGKTALGEHIKALQSERDAALAAKEEAERERGLALNAKDFAERGLAESALCRKEWYERATAAESTASALKAEVEAAEKRAAASHRHAEAEAHAHDGTIRERNEARAAASALRERAEDLATALTILCDLHQNAVGVAWDEARRLIAAAPPHEET